MESFSDQMARTHNTKPMMNARRIDDKNMMYPAGVGGNPTNGPVIGVISGFQVAVTAPTTSKVRITRGLAVGPDGEEIRLAVDPRLSATDYQRALAAAFFEFDVRNNLVTPGGSAPTDYDAIDPATHSILIALDMLHDRFKAYKITNAD